MPSDTQRSRLIRKARSAVLPSTMLKVLAPRAPIGVGVGQQRHARAVLVAGDDVDRAPRPAARRRACRSGSVWISEQSARQYSDAVLVVKIFGTPPSWRWRRSRPSVWPVTRVGLLVGSEREQAAKAARVGLRRLPVALVEFAAARAGDVRDQAVEDLTARFVEVQAVVHELAQEPSALRAAVAIGEVEAAGGRVVGRGVVAQPGDAVARGQQARCRRPGRCGWCRRPRTSGRLENRLRARRTSRRRPAGRSPRARSASVSRGMTVRWPAARVADGQLRGRLVHVGGGIRLVGVRLLARALGAAASATRRW